jgi:hypothetical protein
VAVGDAEGDRALGDDGGECRAADLDDGSADELREVQQMAADVGECTGAGTALVPPGDR